MKRTYTVSKDEKSGLWYVHKVGCPWIPVFGSFSKSKRAAQKHAAACMALPLEEYLQLAENFRNLMLEIASKGREIK